MADHIHRRGPPIPKLPPWLLEMLYLVVQATAIAVVGAIVAVLARTGGAPEIVYSNIAPAAIVIALLNMLRQMYPSQNAP